MLTKREGFTQKIKPVGRLSKTTFIHISVHLYSSNVVTLSKPNLINKQQILLNLCLLLTYYTYGYSYLVLGVLQPTGPRQSPLPQLTATRSTGNISVRTESQPQQHTWTSEFFVLFPLKKITAALSLHFQHLLWRLKAKRFKTYSKEEALYIVHINSYNEHICTEWHSQNVEVFRHFCGMLCLRHNTVHYFTI